MCGPAWSWRARRDRPRASLAIKLVPRHRANFLPAGTRDHKQSNNRAIGKLMRFGRLPDRNKLLAGEDTFSAVQCACRAAGADHGVGIDQSLLYRPLAAGHETAARPTCSSWWTAQVRRNVPARQLSNRDRDAATSTKRVDIAAVIGGRCGRMWFDNSEIFRRSRRQVCAWPHYGLPLSQPPDHDRAPSWLDACARCAALPRG